jgi:hypothetical protein
MKITIEIQWKRQAEAVAEQPNPGMPTMPARPSLQMPTPTPTNDIPQVNFYCAGGTYW